MNGTSNTGVTQPTYADRDQVQGLVHTAERGHVDGLATHDTGGTDTGRVFARAGQADGGEENLDGVLVGQQVDDVEGVLDDADGHHLLAVVAALEHQGVHQALDDGALEVACG